MFDSDPTNSVPVIDRLYDRNQNQPHSNLYTTSLLLRLINAAQRAIAAKQLDYQLGKVGNSHEAPVSLYTNRFVLTSLKVCSVICSFGAHYQ